MIFVLETVSFNRHSIIGRTLLKLGGWEDGLPNVHKFFLPSLDILPCGLSVLRRTFWIIARQNIKHRHFVWPDQTPLPDIFNIHRSCPASPANFVYSGPPNFRFGSGWLVGCHIRKFQNLSSSKTEIGRTALPLASFLCRCVYFLGFVSHRLLGENWIGKRVSFSCKI